MATDTAVVETAPPPAPEETDLVEGAPTSEAPAPTTSPAPVPTLSTSRISPSTSTSEVTGKVGIAYSGELKVGGSVAVVDIEGKFGVELSVELTAKLGTTIAVDTPSKHSAHARSGAYRLKTYGCNQYLYGNCTRGVKKNVTIYTPRRVGRVLWETK
jgi:hypothetical protein